MLTGMSPQVIVQPRPQVPWDVYEVRVLPGGSGGQDYGVIWLARVWLDLIRDTETSTEILYDTVREVMGGAPWIASAAGSITRSSDVAKLPPDAQIVWLAGEIRRLSEQSR